MDPKAALRFLPSRLAAGENDYVPLLSEVKPNHFVAEHDPLEAIMAKA
jgi:peptide/nickel transport system ATP-binding protein